ncbi:MAG: hypothetical protein ACM3ZE_18270 [Myxococcales bacterium]
MAQPLRAYADMELRHFGMVRATVGLAAVRKEPNMKRFLTSVALGLCVLAVNPMVACQSEAASDFGFEFDEADMRQAVVGSYIGTTKDTGQSVRVILEQTGAPTAKSAQHYKRVQCSTRSFVKPAAACLDTTEMEITAHVTSERPEMADVDLTGKFGVYGFELSRGQLSLFGVGQKVMLHATFSSDAGGLIEWRYETDSAALSLELTKETPQ